eukprot:CAMPEP_0115707030 /NCGR_PEP_ID=MMETSP0272-20121206/71121_1 /TAXON_ID=71861 /ORGANISM="Scrippsiella trochoidea, Strain CCMP3099" /LENGTH=65 /DNA_ID=CAMNT_0003148347 /DNA_START=529 /DNA_END=726 /DNA_ORIENTATION=-
MRSQLVGEAGSERDASVVLQSDFDAHAARKSKGSNKRTGSSVGTTVLPAPLAAPSRLKPGGGRMA